MTEGEPLPGKLWAQISVERALGEFRAARPVAVLSEDVLILAFPVEGLTQVQWQLLQRPGCNPRLIIPAGKTARSGGENAAALAIQLEFVTPETVKGFLGLSESHNGPVHNIGRAVTSEAEIAALALASHSFLLPAVIAIEGRAAGLDRQPILSVTARDALMFRDREAKTLNIVARTFVPLDGAGLCEFVVFRGGSGFRDQIAVIAGDPLPGRPALAHIHAACLTADLFDSLKCDCGGRLRGTVKAFSEQGGGILLYLDQKGHSNGIANRLHASSRRQQASCFDNTSASCGNGEDRRRPELAAEMLRQLGFTSIRLVSSNPHEVAALRRAGLEVTPQSAAGRSFQFQT